MTQAGARGPASPPKLPPTSTIKGVSPRPATAVPAKGTPPAPTVTSTKPTAPLAPKIGTQPATTIPRAPRQPSSPDHPVAPTPPWRILPDAPSVAQQAAVPKVVVAPDPETTDDEVTRVGPSPIEEVTRVAPAAYVEASRAPVATNIEVSRAAPAAPATAPVLPTEPPIQRVERAPAPAVAVARAETPEELQLRIRAAVDEALAPVQQTVRELLRRIEELERRPAQPAAPVVTMLPSHAMASPSEPYRRQQPSYPAAIAVSVAPSPQAVSAQGPVLNLAAIERDVHVQMDGGLDGRRRRRRLVWTLVLFVLVVFGGLGAALASSYTPHH